MTPPEKLCTFTIDGTSYGVDVTRVQEVLGDHAITRVPLAPPSISGLINLRGQIVTAFDMRRCCGLAAAPHDTPRMGVVVHTDGRIVCLIVDEIGDVVAVDTADFEPVPETVPAGLRRLVRGAYKLAHTLVLAVDIDIATQVTAEPELARTADHEGLRS